jgi:ATP-dependent RNA helicase DDX54/DBP10
MVCSYSLTDGASSFAKQAHRVTFDLTNDEGKADKSNQPTWDKKKKRFVKGDGVGADNVKMVRTESGTRLPATFRSGRFDEWKAKSRMSLPRIGEVENPSQNWRKRSGPGGHRFKHTKVVEAKPLDKLSKDYERKVRQLNKKIKEGPSSDPRSMSGGKSARHGGKTYSRVKTELKTSQQIRKDRKLVENRRAKNARPSRCSGRKGKR